VAKVKIAIFEGPMCCPGGLCGPAPDPTLIDAQNAMKEIQKEFKDSVEVARVNIVTDFKGFLDNLDVYQKITKEGLSVLPITKINDRVIAERGYPTLETLRNELERLLINS